MGKYTFSLGSLHCATIAFVFLNSNVLIVSFIFQLFEAIPPAAQSFEWSLTFSTELHGFSLKTLYRRSGDFVCGDLHPNADCHLAYTADDFTGKAHFSKHSTLSAVQQNLPCVLLIKDTNDCVYIKVASYLQIVLESFRIALHNPIHQLF